MARKHTHIDIVQKFYANIAATPADCWEWQRRKSKDGYGQISVAGRNLGVHRFAWELLRGPIPNGLTIDHLCRNRCCCNPAHLEVVTPAENTMRGNGISVRNAKKTHCSKGHEFTPDNIDWRYNKTGKIIGRGCRKCRLKFKGLGWRKHITECKHGHPFNEANTYYRIDSRNGKTYRMCRTCHMLSQRRRYHRLKR